MDIEELAQRIDATIIRKTDDAYAAAAASSLHASVPDVIVQPRSAVGVADAVRFAVQNNLEISVRCGGHGTPPETIADGLLIDLLLLCTIDVLDDNVVRVGGGAR